MATELSLFCLHFLGGSARTWRLVEAALGSGIRCIALDLPGFGDAAGQPGASVTDMAAAVARHVGDSAANRRWWVAGHSMGAKVAMAVARAAEDGEPGLEGLCGLALLAGSPPCPEPMADEKRAEMMAWIDGSDGLRREKASAYIADNVGSPLDDDVENRAIDDVLRANPAAWTSWLTHGSREDWQLCVGVLRTPALILSGTRDQALGPSVQVRLTAPHFAEHRHVRLEGTGHLLPIERPGEVARYLREAMVAPDRR